VMDSCMDNNADRPELEVDHQKKDYSSEISISSDTQLSSIEEREHLQVYLRIRPFTSAESSNGESQDCVALEPPDTVLLKPPSHSLSARMSTDRSLPQTGQRFQFSQVYGPETTQRELFEGTVKDLVKDVLEGENSLVFTYGVTNAGKTFTFLGPDADAGILPRCLDVIFSNIDELVFPGMSIKPHRCREFTRLTREQQAEEVLFKRNLFKQLKEVTCAVSVSDDFHEKDKISLEVEANTKFSVWVSFCEIYNENIHDLLEVMPSGAPRRTVLRLSQDVKGNSFVKDLHWVQVNTAEEAYKVMKLGKRNQSFSSTRLNQLSSRSHSIFSIRILRIEDVGTPRVHAVSEMCLCDLAGSERCAKTQNQGDRLKEAGNINTSLLTLGKCITALRHNQQAKLLHHVPFRESKLTHYLQSFFCGRGKACMIVNINQCASMYDETLNVLKFSAVAQKVVVLSTRPPPSIPQRSACEPSITNNGERKPLRSRRSSLIGWESSLEDVQEDVDNEYEEDTSLMDITLDQTGNEEDQVALLKQLQMQLKKERVENLLMEARVREEISREFSELFSEMQNDYKNQSLWKLLQVRTETERAEQALVQLQTVQLQLDEHLKVTEEKTSQIQTLVLEAQSLKQLQKTSDKLIDDLKQKFNEQVESGEHLKAELEEFRIKASSCSSTYVAEEELKMLNSGLQTEVKYLKEKPAIIEDTKKSPCKPEDGTASLEMDRQLEEKLAVAQKASAEREAELQKKLEETEAQVTSLQKNLKEAQEKWEEEESQAVQDTRRKEVERRRELLAVAHEAIAQKDEEMEKKAEEIIEINHNTIHSCALCQVCLTGCPSVLDSSEISTENGRTSRFPRPELEISFSPLQPNRMALRRQGEESAVTVKITRPARKRKSSEMETVRTNQIKGAYPHLQILKQTLITIADISVSSIRSRKEGTLQKIGDFLQSSPTLLGTKAKKMMSLVSGRGDVDSAASSSSLSLRAKKNKRKLYRPEISSPMDMPSHPIISREPEDKDSDHQIIKRRLRSRVAK
uniref:Kinesin family member 20Ba n=1 Tax=Echeneis naucrates TaxID=173247 RepID=A0A665VNR2_ECHNA